MFCYYVDSDISLVLVNSKFAKEVATLVNNQRDYLGEWLPWVANNNEEAYKAFVHFTMHHYADDKALHTHIIYKGDIVGSVSLNTINATLKKVEIGYWLSYDYQGRGIMTKAVHAIMKIAKDVYDAQVAIIKAAEHNLPSRRVAERLGFTYDGVIANNELVNGQILNHVIYSCRL